MSFKEYAGRYVGCNPQSVGQEADRHIAVLERRIVELETFLKELRADLDAEHGRKRVDVNWPKFAKILGD